MRWSCLSLVLIGIGTFATFANGSGPADDLFRLVPADSGLTLAVEDLRGHWREIKESPLYDGLSRLAVVRAWLDSDRFRKFERIAKEMQTVLGVPIEVIRDELLGDSVVFALQPGPAAQPDLARGLLLVRPRDRSLIARFLKSLNEIQTKAGELDRVESRPRGSLTYMARQFKAGQRPPEFYVQLEDGTLAWSNSEGMIQEVIDRKSAVGSGLGDDAGFQKVRRGLPDRALLSLFINPRLIERLIIDPARSSKTAQDWSATVLTRYLGALTQVGFAVQWRDGFVIHSHEVFEPEKLEAWLKRWLTRPASPVVSLDRVPATAVAVVSANLDFEAFAEAARELVPEQDQASYVNLKLIAQGILLGHDPVTWLFPRIDHGGIAYLEVEPKPETRPDFPWVAVLGWQSKAGLDDLAGPIDNAIRTMFAMAAVDPRTRESQMKIEARSVGETRLTTLLKGARLLLAYRTDHAQLVIGNSADAVARFGNSPTNSTLAQIRAKHAAEAETFIVVDVQRLTAEIKHRQAPFARRLAARSHRPVHETERDLAQLLDLAGLFQAFTFSTITSKNAAQIHRTISLIAR